jgi:hypothetical protein
METYCNLSCKYAKLPYDIMDGSFTCRTFTAIFCIKKNKPVPKLIKCKDYKQDEETKRYLQNIKKRT